MSETAPLPATIADPATSGSKTLIHFMEPQDRPDHSASDLVFLNVNDVVRVDAAYHVIHHKFYDADHRRMEYFVGPPAEQHPNATKVSVGWSEEVQPS